MSEIFCMGQCDSFAAFWLQGYRVLEFYSSDYMGPLDSQGLKGHKLEVMASMHCIEELALKVMVLPLEAVEEYDEGTYLVALTSSNAPLDLMYGATMENTLNGVEEEEVEALVAEKLS